MTRPRWLKPTGLHAELVAAHADRQAAERELRVVRAERDELLEAKRQLELLVADVQAQLAEAAAERDRARRRRRWLQAAVEQHLMTIDQLKRALTWIQRYRGVHC